MRIHYVHLRNFRGVSDRRVDFADSGVTVIEGSNEVGKTSMIEAIDLLLKSPDSAKSSQVLAARPKNIDAGPDVEAEFTAGEYRFVYRKRWYKRPETTLRVVEPTPATLTGREAHQRVEQMLAETLDGDLWAALRIEQNRPISQSALGGNDSLARALDAAAGGTQEANGESTVFERVEREFLQYYTPASKPKAELRTADERLAEAKRTVAAAELSLREVERDVERHGELTRELQVLAASQVKQEAELAECLRLQRDLDEQRTHVANLANRFGVASREADAAEAAVAGRREFVSAVAELENTVAATGDEVSRAEATAETARGLRSESERALTDAKQAFDDASRGERQAAEHVRYLHDKAELENLGRREARATEAIRQRDLADAFLAVCALDEAGFAQVQNAETARRETRAVLEAAAPTVVLDALSAIDILVNGEQITLTPGDSTRQSVTDALELAIPDLAVLRIEPGSGRDLKKAAESADAEFRRCCTEMAVSDLADARAVIANRREAEGNRREAEQALELALDGQTLDDIRSGRVRASARVSAYSPTGVPQTDLTSATAAELHARARTETARLKLSDASDICQERQAAETNANNTAIVLRAQANSAQEQLALAREKVANARLLASDEALTAKLAAAQAARSDARLALNTAEELLAAQDPDAAEARLAEAQVWGERLRKDYDAGTSEVDKLTGRLELAGTEGRQGRLDEARTALEKAERQYDSVQSRANAARLLFEKLHAARETAKRAYVKPFRDQIERLGRIVFGQSLRLDIDSDLRIVSRTLADVTVRYEDLSTGAREQLCIISRLACSALIDPADGAPVIIDDALGHSDPERLARTSAAFNAADTNSQIIVLTCTPERYRRVGAAKVVPLRHLNEPAEGAPEREDFANPAEAILACLEREGRQLGKAEIIRLAGIDETQWGPAIRSLLDQDKVVKTGDRRGAVYGSGDALRAGNSERG